MARAVQAAWVVQVSRTVQAFRVELPPLHCAIPIQLPPFLLVSRRVFYATFPSEATCDWSNVSAHPTVGPLRPLWARPFRAALSLGVLMTPAVGAAAVQVVQRPAHHLAPLCGVVTARVGLVRPSQNHALRRAAFHRCILRSLPLLKLRPWPQV